MSPDAISFLQAVDKVFITIFEKHLSFQSSLQSLVENYLSNGDGAMSRNFVGKFVNHKFGEMFL